MKQILTLILLNAIYTLQGQTIQYLDNNPVWKIFRSDGPCIEYGEYNYFLSGDTLIGNKQYKKVFSKGYMYGAGGPDLWCPKYFHSYLDETPYAYLRQENRKLYCIYKNCQPPNEVLLYDFSLKQNDTVKFYYSCDTSIYYTAIIETVDSILTDTIYRKVLNLKHTNDCGMGMPPEKIIEGIGNDNDLFAFCDAETRGNTLTCFGLNGKTIYSAYGDSCELDININIKEKSIKNHIVLVYPNPANETITIEIKDLRFANYDLRICNLTGQELIRIEGKRQKAKVDIGAFPKGIYFVKLITDKGIEVRKVIKE